MYDEPKLIHAGQALDDRGALAFCNDFNLAGVVRFYAITNHRQGFVRAWHGHWHSDTFLWPMSGVWRVVGVLKDGKPGQRLVSHVIDRTAIFHVPAGWYHGHQNLTTKAVLGVFSTATIEQAHDDDHREPWDWIGAEVWETVPR